MQNPRLDAIVHATRYSGPRNACVYHIPLGEITDASSTCVHVCALLYFYIVVVGLLILVR